MKKIFLLFVLITSFAFAQESNSNQNFSELKLNGLMFAAGALEITYERTLNEESAIGVSGLYAYDKKDIAVEYYISPYYRFYFGEKYAAGFFVEGFGMLNSSERIAFIFGTDDYATDFALGVGLGGKWVTKKGFIGELNLGVGRNLFNTENTDSAAVGKIGITIGYRF